MFYIKRFAIFDYSSKGWFSMICHKQLSLKMIFHVTGAENVDTKESGVRFFLAMRIVCDRFVQQIHWMDLLALRNSKHWNRQTPPSSRHTRRSVCDCYSTTTTKKSICLSISLSWHERVCSKPTLHCSIFVKIYAIPCVRFAFAGDTCVCRLW